MYIYDMCTCRWAYLLGREGLSYQKGQQKLLRRQLWSGFTPMEDVTSSEGSDDDEDGSGDSAFQVLHFSFQFFAVSYV